MITDLIKTVDNNHREMEPRKTEKEETEIL